MGSGRHEKRGNKKLIARTIGYNGCDSISM